MSYEDVTTKPMITGRIPLSSFLPLASASSSTHRITISLRHYNCGRRSASCARSSRPTIATSKYLGSKSDPSGVSRPRSSNRRPRFCRACRQHTPFRRLIYWGGSTSTSRVQRSYAGVGIATSAATVNDR